MPHVWSGGDAVNIQGMVGMLDGEDVVGKNLTAQQYDELRANPGFVPMRAHTYAVPVGDIPHKDFREWVAKNHKDATYIYCIPGQHGQRVQVVAGEVGSAVERVLWVQTIAPEHLSHDDWSHPDYAYLIDLVGVPF
jgi:hypothetical protein